MKLSILVVSSSHLSEVRAIISEEFGYSKVYNLCYMSDDLAEKKSLGRRDFLKVAGAAALGLAAAGCGVNPETARNLGDYQPIKHGERLILDKVEAGKINPQAIKIEYNSAGIQMLYGLQERLSTGPNGSYLYSPVRFEDGVERERLIGEILSNRVQEYKVSSRLAPGINVGMYVDPGIPMGAQPPYRVGEISSSQKIWGLPVISAKQDLMMMPDLPIPVEHDPGAPPAADAITITEFSLGYAVGQMLPQADGSSTFRIAGYVADGRALEAIA